MDPINGSLILRGKSYDEVDITVAIQRDRPYQVVLINYYNPKNPYLSVIAKTAHKIHALGIVTTDASHPGNLREDFVSFVSAKGFAFPSRLEVNKEPWFDGVCTNALIQNSIKINFLNIKKTGVTPEDLVEMIKGDVLQSPCHLEAFFEKSLDGALQKDVAQALLAKNIKLSHLRLVPAFSMTTKLRCEVIEKLLINDCSLKIHYNALEDEIINALNNKIKSISELTLTTNFSINTPNIRLDQLKELISKAKKFNLSMRITQNYPADDPLITIFPDLIPIPIDNIKYKTYHGFSVFPAKVRDALQGKSKVQNP